MLREALMDPRRVFNQDETAVEVSLKTTILICPKTLIKGRISDPKSSC